MYPKHVGHENGGCGHLGGAPLSRPTFGGHSCKKDCMVAPHESVLVNKLDFGIWRLQTQSTQTPKLTNPCLRLRPSKKGLSERP